MLVLRLHIIIGVCFVTLVTLYKRLLLKNNCRQTIGLWLWGQLGALDFKASYHSQTTEPVINVDLQGQLLAYIYRTSYRYRSTGPVIGPFLWTNNPVISISSVIWIIHFKKSHKHQHMAYETRERRSGYRAEIVPACTGSGVNRLKEQIAWVLETGEKKMI